jgi:hypothetical protein
MYRTMTPSILDTRHIHRLITLTPGREEMETVVRCSSCSRIMLVEDDCDHAEECVAKFNQSVGMKN